MIVYFVRHGETELDKKGFSSRECETKNDLFYKLKF